MPTVLPQKPSQKRIDPVGRPVTGVTTRSTEVLNRDPTKHYVLVYKGDVDFGIPHYEALGYVIEMVRKDGPRLAGGNSTTDGDVIEHRSHVLMSCPIEVLKARFAQEQAGHDIVERKIFNSKSGVVDPARGINKQVLREGWLRFENETTEARDEALGG